MTAPTASPRRSARLASTIRFIRYGFPRGTLDVDDAVSQLKAQTKPPIKAVIMIATDRAAAKFIEKTHDTVSG